jgi:hypothetical protein
MRRWQGAGDKQVHQLDNAPAGTACSYEIRMPFQQGHRTGYGHTAAALTQHGQIIFSISHADDFRNGQAKPFATLPSSCQ